jgi:hypothetical protein
MPATVLKLTMQTGLKNNVYNNVSENLQSREMASGPFLSKEELLSN